MRTVANEAAGDGTRWRTVETKDLLSNSQTIPDSTDIYHFSRQSLHILGGMFFEQYRKLRKRIL